MNRIQSSVAHEPRDGGGESGGLRYLLTVTGLLWLAGLGLRLTILAVPPVLPAIHSELHLSATEVGLLGSLPVALFALAALPGSLLIARFGARSSLVLGLLITAVGSALRGLSPDAAILYATTVVMGMGVAVMQPSMAVVVRQWLPTRIGFGTALYSNGLLFGEVFAVWLTIPYLLPLVDGNWRAVLALWSLPVAVTAALVGLFAPRKGASPATPSMPGLWWPDWRSPRIWLLGLLFGGINSTYFGANSFLPDYLTSLGRADLIAGSLTALNAAQIPSSLLLLAVAGRVERRAWPYIVFSVLMALGVVGLLLPPGVWTYACTAVLGFSTSGALILGLTLPALLGESHDVARTSAAMFTISYASAVVIAVVSGFLWDVTGIPAVVFLPIGLTTLAVALAAILLRRRAELR